MKTPIEDTDQSIKQLALAIAVAAVRNTSLEDLHAGRVPDSEVGDYSDVKVVSPHGEIPWNELSRFDDDEMKCLMKQVVTRLYTCLRFLITDPNNEHFHRLIDYSLRPASGWNDPEIDEDLTPPGGLPHNSTPAND